MATTTPSIIAPDGDDIQVAHDKAAQAISLLSTETDITISAEDRRTLTDFYSGLEKRRALLGQSENDDSPTAIRGEIYDAGDVQKDEDIAKAFEFAKFLASLDPGDLGTQLLIEGNRHVTAALGAIEKGGNFLENAPMTQILDLYERIKSREESLKSSGGPVSVVTARIYLSDANAFAAMVKMLIVLDIEGDET
ncbi:hypothetical protein B0H13DRAFT_2513641 [Mycena leptocephala]|nr:hypothetical protein B0H13DRAFT_2513641 [Mycena leptocephala]